LRISGGVSGGGRRSISAFPIPIPGEERGEWVDERAMLTLAPVLVLRLRPLSALLLYLSLLLVLEFLVEAVARWRDARLASRVARLTPLRELGGAMAAVLSAWVLFSWSRFL